MCSSSQSRQPPPYLWDDGCCVHGHERHHPCAHGFSTYDYTGRYVLFIQLHGTGTLSCTVRNYFYLGTVLRKVLLLHYSLVPGRSTSTERTPKSKKYFASMASLMPSLLATAASAHTFELWLDLRRSPSTTTRSMSLFDRVIVAEGQHPEELQIPHICVSNEQRLIENDVLIGACCRVDEPEDQNSARSLVGCVNWLLLEACTAPMIVSENLLGAAEGTPTRVAVAVSSATDVGGLAFALDRGVDALVCDATLLDGAEGIALEEALQICKAQRLERQAATPLEIAEATDARLALQSASLTRIAHGGTADRVALDFTRLMGLDEGCLIGSSAKVSLTSNKWATRTQANEWPAVRSFVYPRASSARRGRSFTASPPCLQALALVHAETVESGFVPPRPFRVNAGPVHSYVLMADESTKYLSELKAGDVVLGVARDGTTRPATIGRY